MAPGRALSLPARVWVGSVFPHLSPQPLQPLLTVGGGEAQPGAGGARASVTVRAHCRGPFPFPLGGLGLCVLFLLEGVQGVASLDRCCPSSAPPPACPPGPGGGLTEALLEPDSSSALGCAVPFRLRGLGTAAFRRLLGGLLDESSYSSAKEKRSLNLTDGGSCGVGPPTSEPRPLPAPVSSSLQPHGLAGHRVCVLSSPPPLRLLPPLPEAKYKEPHFILWASSQLACTCCRACRIGVWLKTRGRRRESSQVPGAP